MIESVCEPVIIPWGEEGEDIVRGLEHAEHTGRLARRAQRYTVQIPARARAALVAAGDVECIQERFYVLRRMSRYDDEEGLSGDGAGVFRAEDWIQ